MSNGVALTRAALGAGQKIRTAVIGVAILAFVGGVAMPADAATEKISPRPTTLIASTRTGELVQLNSSTGAVQSTIITDAQLTSRIDELGLRDMSGDCRGTIPSEYVEFSRPNLDRVHNKVYFLPLGFCTIDSVLSVNLDGSDLQVVAKNAEYFSVNDQGTQMVYENSVFTQAAPYGRTMIRTLDSGQEKVLFNDFSSNFTWSADGTKIAGKVANCKGQTCSEVIRIFDASTKYSSVDDGTLVKIPKGVIDFNFTTFLPNGDLLVELTYSESVTHTETVEINTSGTIVRTIAQGLKGQAYSSTATDVTGQHLLVTLVAQSGKWRLLVVDGSHHRTFLATNITSADW